jgi:hypothetical protein
MGQIYNDKARSHPGRGLLPAVIQFGLVVFLAWIPNVGFPEAVNPCILNAGGGHHQLSLVEGAVVSHTIPALLRILFRFVLGGEEVMHRIGFDRRATAPRQHYQGANAQKKGLQYSHPIQLSKREAWKTIIIIPRQ